MTDSTVPEKKKAPPSPETTAKRLLKRNATVAGIIKRHDADYLEKVIASMEKRIEAIPEAIRASTEKDYRRVLAELSDAVRWYRRDGRRLVGPLRKAEAGEGAVCVCVCNPLV